MKAVLIDDEFLVLDLLEKKLLKIKEVEVLGKYTNPFQGLEEVIKSQPDVVFLDIEMPEISGIDLAKGIKKAFPDIKIVFITACERYAVQAFDQYGYDYMLKPFDDERIIKTISRLSINMIKGTTPACPMVCCFQKLNFKYYGKNTEEIDVHWRTSKTRELFAFLIQNRRNFVQKDVLLKHFWPDVEVKEGYSQLYSTIYQIRRLLKSIGFNIAIISSENSYKLELNNVLLDVDELEKGIEGLPLVMQDTISKHQEIIELYKGDYFEEDGFWWTEQEKTRLQSIWQKQLKRIADFYIFSENYSEAIIQYLKIQKVLPSNDESYFILMQLYNEFGDRYSVKEQYTQLKKMLLEEYSTEPDETIQKWYQTWEEKVKNSNTP
ncbi:hypothetical protein J6TS1_19180 [Siminovitchia terrae]|uniref:Response regulator n=1 Tax=Siminovitchia terrae TaxID=1914933 RepID=A0A429X0Y3_SIMTE|nr:response regulator [Siminovitchia terrae]RST57043.1 response regulator [Siminovitchia terrae]GIN96048.1 hypothetical protein J6TS1_19180 [Siminovitchia terrae]